MTFDEWWAKQPKDPTRPVDPRMAWEAATLEERAACADCVPRNWLDPMLTGPMAVIGYVADARPIEAVLRATKARIMERSNRRMK